MTMQQFPRLNPAQHSRGEEKGSEAVMRGAAGMLGQARGCHLMAGCTVKQLFSKDADGPGLPCAGGRQGEPDCDLEHLWDRGRRENLFAQLS